MNKITHNYHYTAPEGLEYEQDFKCPTKRYDVHNYRIYAEKALKEFRKDYKWEKP